jgi:hypothetical protein
MNCPCDVHVCPAPMAIAAGLACLPRAPGLFPDWREGLLAAVGREPALDGWRAREPGDLGLMLVEMGAYVLDVASFYDQLVANESYLGTARLEGQQRRHISLLGYRPRPAVASSVWLAAEADGTRVVQLPAGTAVRSGEFDGNPPQVFELDADAAVEPRVNRLEVDRVPASALPSPLTGLPVKTASLRARGGELLVLQMGSSLAVTHASTTMLLLLRIRQAVTQLGFNPAVTPPAGATYQNTRVLKAGNVCGAWKLTPGTGEPAVLSGAQLSLDTRLDLQPGDIVAVTDGTASVARRVASVTQVQYTVLSSLTSTLTDANNNNIGSLVSPPIKTGVTRVTFDSALPFGSAANLTVHHSMVDAATVHVPLKDTLAQTDPIVVPGFMDAPRTDITRLLLEDAHGDGAAATGVLDVTTHTAIADSAPAWGLALWAPVQLYGNVVGATRGETVRGERLGEGDAAQPTQSFRLKKKPLTYLPADNVAGRKSTLVVRVGGIQWQEVESFYGQPADATVYVVKHDDEGHADVQFGGAARLPTGAAVTADYRFGAGAAVPPADSVKQIARPVVGLRKIRNVLPAYGGADAEGQAELAVRGPDSALLLGRAISLVDLEVAAAKQPGVRAARAAWRWDAQGLRPAAVVSYIGDSQLAPSLRAVLRALAEDDAPITVVSAPPQPARLDVDIEIDPLHVSDDVVAAVCKALFDQVTLPGTGGRLRPERLGPDGVVFASVVVQAVMAVPGVADLRSLSFDDTSFIETGRSPAAGMYFDFADGGIWVNGTRA